MSILHQYHKENGLKACTTMCQSEKWKWGNIFKMAGKRSVVHFSSLLLVVCGGWGGGGGYCCSERIWNNYIEIHLKSMQVIFWSDQAARSLKENTSTSWSDRKADSMRLGGEHKTKLNYSFNVLDQIWRVKDQNEMKLQGEYDYECIRNSLSSYPILSR